MSFFYQSEINHWSFSSLKRLFSQGKMTNKLPNLEVLLTFLLYDLERPQCHHNYSTALKINSWGDIYLLLHTLYYFI